MDPKELQSRIEGKVTTATDAEYENLRRGMEQCLKSVDRPGKGRTFPGDRMKVPS